MAQHGMRESGLYQLIHLQGSGAPHLENPEWTSGALRALRFDVSNVVSPYKSIFYNKMRHANVAAICRSVKPLRGTM